MCYGDITQVLINDKDINHYNNVYITFSDHHGAKKCIRARHNKLNCHKAINVFWARPKISDFMTLKLYYKIKQQIKEVCKGTQKYNPNDFKYLDDLIEIGGDINILLTGNNPNKNNILKNAMSQIQKKESNNNYKQKKPRLVETIYKPKLDISNKEFHTKKHQKNKKLDDLKVSNDYKTKDSYYIGNHNQNIGSVTQKEPQYKAYHNTNQNEGQYSTKRDIKNQSNFYNLNTNQPNLSYTNSINQNIPNEFNQYNQDFNNYQKNDLSRNQYPASDLNNTDYFVKSHVQNQDYLYNPNSMYYAPGNLQWQQNYHNTMNDNSYYSNYGHTEYTQSYLQQAYTPDNRKTYDNYDFDYYENPSFRVDSQQLDTQNAIFNTAEIHKNTQSHMDFNNLHDQLHMEQRKNGFNTENNDYKQNPENK